MTRVLPEPAPARISSGPSVCRRRPLLGIESGEEVHVIGLQMTVVGRGSRVESTASRPADSLFDASLFDRDAFREISRLIDVAAAPHRDVVREELQRHDHRDGRDRRDRRN